MSASSFEDAPNVALTVHSKIPTVRVAAIIHYDIPCSPISSPTLHIPESPSHTAMRLVFDPCHGVTPCEHASPLTRLDRLNRLSRYARIPSGSRRSFAPRSPASRREIEILVSDRYGRDNIPLTFVICFWLEPISVASSHVTRANLPKDLHLASIFDPGPQLHILHRNKSPSHFHSLTSTDRLCTLELHSHA